MNDGIQLGPGGVPLVCLVCPNEPRFSDLSHLLTHVGSKAHLSYHFKLSVRAPRDPAVRDQLDNYDYWCDRFRINQSLAGRMANKENKNRKDRAKRERDPSSPPARAGKYARKPVKIERAEPKVQYRPTGPVTRSQCKVLESREEARGRDSGYNLRGSGILQANDARQLHEDSISYRSRSISVSPSPRRSYRRSPSAGSNTSISTLSVLPSDDEEDVQSTDPILAKAGIKLKGIIYPGMDIFDSASEAVKKTRNQKKDGTALAEMRKQSAMIIPNELIFHGDGEFKRQRPIQGYGSDECPTTPECTPPPKKATRPRKRTILGELDANARAPPVQQTKTTSKATEGRKPRKPRTKKEDKPSTMIDLANLSADQVTALREVLGMSQPCVRSRTGTKGESNARLTGRTTWQPSEEEKAEWKMTVNALHPIRNRAFQIFEDNNELPPIREPLAPKMMTHVDPLHCSQPLPSGHRSDLFSNGAPIDYYSQLNKHSGENLSHYPPIFGLSTPLHPSHKSSSLMPDHALDSNDYGHMYDPVAPLTMRRISSFDFDTSLSMSHSLNFPTLNMGCQPDGNSLRSSATRYHGGSFYDPFPHGIDLGYPTASTTDSNLTESPTERLSRKAASKLPMLHGIREDIDMENPLHPHEVKAAPEGH